MLGMGLVGPPSVPRSLSFLLSLPCLSLALVRADPAESGVGLRILYCIWGEGSLGSIFGGLGASARVILVLR